MNGEPARTAQLRGPQEAKVGRISEGEICDPKRSRLQFISAVNPRIEEGGFTHLRMGPAAEPGWQYDVQLAPAKGGRAMSSSLFLSSGHLGGWTANVVGRCPSGGWLMQFASRRKARSDIYFASMDPDARAKDFLAKPGKA